MKKYIAIFAVILIIAAGAFFAKSQFTPPQGNQEKTTAEDLSDFFFVQYCVYAPESAKVSLDSKAVSYNENIDCFSTEVTKEGNYTLLITQEGCETIEETVYISAENREYKPSFSYTDSFISDSQEEGRRLLEAIMQKCWSLDYDLSEFNFLSEDAKTSCEEKLADVVTALEENLSAEYTVGELKVTLTPFSDTSPSTAPDSEGNSVFASFDAQYSYRWQFGGTAYTDSGTAQRKSKPYIIIEKYDGEWYIRDFYISLDNGTM